MCPPYAIGPCGPDAFASVIAADPVLVHKPRTMHGARESFLNGSPLSGVIQVARDIEVPMLYIALVMSAILLVVVNKAARRPSRRVLANALGGLGVSIITGCGCFLPPVVLQAALLCVVGLVWQTSRGGSGRFLALSIGATIAAYLLVGVSVMRTQSEYARLRQKYPYESMEGRVPRLPAQSEQAPIYDSVLLGEIEKKGGFCYRTSQLEQLHEQTVHLFVNSPGFGVARMIPGPTERGLAYGLHDKLAPPSAGCIGPNVIVFAGIVGRTVSGVGDQVIERPPHEWSS
jgi:hypothetical protein